ncbi:hypothetical protein H2248_012409 [Termitomyces sp. 'cryptogamus']|nr:hypothetical protein H2248_012409 [Termitomyces sp. 'cryptogamus']
MVARNPALPDNLAESIAAIFDQVQLSLANHRKNCVALYKLHQQAAAVTQTGSNGAVVRLVGERKFGDAFIGMVNRVLVVKKGSATADRVIRFIGSYVKFVNEKVSAEKEKAFKDPTSSISARLEDDADDTIASRFVMRLLNWLLAGFPAKNKTVRYRCVCIVSDMISHLGEIDEDTYNLLKDGLMDRTGDKEVFIRAHAVTAISKLAGSEGPDEVDPGEKTILEVLVDVLSYDAAPEVRRAALISIPLLPSTVDAVLSRTRDTDALTRKLVYSNVLQSKLEHPRQLTIAQRELVIKDGLGDREPSVRVAAGKLVTSWFDVVLTEPSETEDFTWNGDDGGIMKGLLRFLTLFDVVGPGEAAAVDAVLSVFVTRPNIPDAFVFPESYWKELNPESAVLARVFLEHCLSEKNETRLEAASLPVVTAFAFLLQDSYNALLNVLQDAENVAFLNAGEPEDDEEEVEKREEERAKKEVILGELLRMSLKLDFMDEIGRRKVFTIVKDMVAHPELPPGLINPCLDVLKEILPTERELIRVVVEIIVDLREDDQDINDIETGLLGDPDMTQTTITKDKSSRRVKPREDMSLDERLEADITDMRCLLLCIGMLERVDGSFEDNSTLEGILTDLIIPSVKRKELIMREKGLISLGLCCLIAQNLALGSFQLFLGQVQNAPEELKIRVLQVIFDILIMYDEEFFSRSDDIAQKITGYLVQTLESEDSALIQTVLCVGLSKLMLAGIIKDPKVLTTLVLTYISPNTFTNQELRQCLSYFFPVYCYSSHNNQTRMQSIFISAFDLFMRIRENLDDDQEMITPLQFGLLLVDWTNPQKSAEMLKTELQSQAPHVEVAADILGVLYDSERSDEVLKVLCQLLGHLYLAPGLDDRSIHKLNLLLSHHEEQSPFSDDSVRKIFDRFYSKFAQMFEKEIQHINPGKYLDEEFLELYNFIGVDPPEENSGCEETPSVSSTSRSQSLVPSDVENSTEVPSLADESDEGTSSPTPGPQAQQTSKLKMTTKHRRKAPASPSVNEQSEGEMSELVTPVASAVTPKRKGVKRIQTPGSATQTSPLIRKKTRVNSARKTRSKKAPVADDESEGDATPTKAT